MIKDLCHNLVLLLIAAFFYSAAIWQILAARTHPLGENHPPLPPPAKTRHAVRPPPRVFSGDPADDYIIRCARGLTNRQIAWIATDFQNAGLDLDLTNTNAPVAQFIAQRKAAQLWYRDALADGLHLTPDQISQVTTHLNRLLDKAKPAFLQSEQTMRPPHVIDASLWNSPETTTARQHFASAIYWLNGEDAHDFEPSSLCALDPRQKLVLKQPLPTPTPEASSADFNKLTSPLKSQPVYHENTPLHLQFAAAYTIFPESVPRVIPDSGNDFLPVIRSLHPAQLKMMLLLDPAMVGRIQQALETGPA